MLLYVFAAVLLQLTTPLTCHTTLLLTHFNCYCIQSHPDIQSQQRQQYQQTLAFLTGATHLYDTAAMRTSIYKEGVFDQPFLHTDAVCGAPVALFDQSSFKLLQHSAAAGGFVDRCVRAFCHACTVQTLHEPSYVGSCAYMRCCNQRVYYRSRSIHCTCTCKSTFAVCVSIADASVHAFNANATLGTSMHMYTSVYVQALTFDSPSM
jgi:hypothetical protein